MSARTRDPRCARDPRTVLRARRLAAALMLAALAAACSSNGETQGARGAQTRAVALWESGDQYVRIEPPAVGPAGRLPPNRHPVRIPPERLEEALRLVWVREEPDDEPEPLFRAETRKLLAAKLAAGLARARAGEDVTFAVEQTYVGFAGLDDVRVVSGRVFFTDRWLHLVLGSVLRENRADEDLGFEPYAPGTRARSVPRDVRLGAPPNSGVFTAPWAQRDDWLVFDPRLVRPAPLAPPPRRGPPPARGP